MRTGAPHTHTLPVWGRRSNVSNSQTSYFTVYIQVSVCNQVLSRNPGYAQWIKCHKTQGHAVPPPLIYGYKAIIYVRL